MPFWVCKQSSEYYFEKELILLLTTLHHSRSLGLLLTFSAKVTFSIALLLLMQALENTWKCSLVLSSGQFCLLHIENTKHSFWWHFLPRCHEPSPVHNLDGHGMGLVFKHPQKLPIWLKIYTDTFLISICLVNKYSIFRSNISMIIRDFEQLVWEKLA